MRFLGGLLSQKISLFLWYVHICLVAINTFGSEWIWSQSLVTFVRNLCFLALFFGVEKNQEQAHAVTIMSLQLVTFRREGSALKLKWLCFFYELYDCWPSWLLHEKTDIWVEDQVTDDQRRKNIIVFINMNIKTNLVKVLAYLIFVNFGTPPHYFSPNKVHQKVR